MTYSKEKEQILLMRLSDLYYWWYNHMDWRAINFAVGLRVFKKIKEQYIILLQSNKQQYEMAYRTK